MILNSDSDSDSDPLEELVFSIKKRSPPTKTSGGKAPVSSLHARPIRTYRYGMDDELRKPPPKSKNTKPSLSRLVEAAQKHAAAEQKMAELKADLEKPLEVPVVENGAIDEDTLAGVVNDEDGEDKAKRLYRAMQRTNALDTECIFHFFGNKPRKGTRRAPFPLHSLPRHGWAANFEGANQASLLADQSANLSQTPGKETRYFYLDLLSRFLSTNLCQKSWRYG